MSTVVNHRPVRVALRATDAVMLAGLTSLLRPDVVVVERHELTERDVMVVQVERWTPRVTAELCRDDVVGRVRKVLLADRCTRSELRTAAECRVVAVLFVARVSRTQLVRTVLSAAGRPEPGRPLDGHPFDSHPFDTVDPCPDGLPHPRKPDGLTVREVNVLRLVAEGYDTAQIAARLCYSERTVKNIVYSLTTRLKLRNRPHAVAYAIRAGVI